MSTFKNTSVTLFILSLVLPLFCLSQPIVVDAGADRTICIGDTSMIGGSPTMSGGTAPITYTWTPATGLSSTSISNPVANPTVNTTYYVTTSDFNGRGGTDSVVVTVDSLPVISFDDFPIACLNVDSIELTQGSPAGGIYSGNGIVTSPFLQPSLAGKGTHTITYTYVGPACSIPIQKSQDIVVDTFPDTKTSVIWDTICLGDTSTIEASGATNYRWTPNYRISDTNLSIVHAYPDTTTTYLVIGSLANGCIDTAGTIVTVEECPPVGIENGTLIQPFSLSPNPSHGIVRFINPSGRPLPVKMLTITGKVIAHFTLHQYEEYIDLTAYDKGVYFVKVIDHSTKTTVKRLVIY